MAARLAQAETPDCQTGLASWVEQPLPAPAQAVSVQPRAFVGRVRLVPPTARTRLDVAG